MEFQERRKRALTRTKKAIRESVGKDNHIINAIATIEELDKIAERLARRLRDWYALYNPELEKEHEDHRQLAEEVLLDPVPPADGMGAALADEDIATLVSQAQLLTTVYAQRDMLLAYLESTMQDHAPNLTAVAGTMVGAKLIQHAGSLEKLAMMPSGTIQVLGAETALFRHLRNRKKRPPKHGVIFNHDAIQTSARGKHGRIARVIADCCAIAARVDHFNGKDVSAGLKQKIEDAR